MRIKYHTNLDDVMRQEVFPVELPVVPRIGDKIQSATNWMGRHIELEVVNVTWKKDNFTHQWQPEIELHLPKSKNMSISMWKAHYDYIRNKIPHEEYVERYTAAEKEFFKFIARV